MWSGLVALCSLSVHSTVIVCECHFVIWCYCYVLHEWMCIMHVSGANVLVLGEY